MHTSDDARIRVHERWDGWRTTEIPFSALRDVRWVQPNGAPRPFLHGTVLCTNVVGAAFDHVCDPSSAPHDVTVCIVRHDLLASVYLELAARVDGSAHAHPAVEPPAASASEQLDRLRRFGYRHHR